MVLVFGDETEGADFLLCSTLSLSSSTSSTTTTITITPETNQRPHMFVTLLAYGRRITTKNFEKRLDNAGAYFEAESYAGLERRLLHALMTNDVFTVTLGGHSSAAGHGNNFNQSYVMQMHEVLAPVFEKLGMTFVGKNAAQGGMGTVQTSLCGGDVYGYDNDVIMWDSMMTEQPNTLHAVDLFVRQAVISGNRVPLFLSTQPTCNRKNVCQQSIELRKNYGIDIGHMILSTWKKPYTSDIPAVEVNEKNIDDIPHALRYMVCESGEMSCKEDSNKYNSVCWEERDDVTPNKFPQVRESVSCELLNGGIDYTGSTNRLFLYHINRIQKPADMRGGTPGGGTTS